MECGNAAQSAFTHPFTAFHFILKDLILVWSTNESSLKMHRSAANTCRIATRLYSLTIQYW